MSLRRQDREVTRETQTCGCCSKFQQQWGTLGIPAPGVQGHLGLSERLLRKGEGARARLSTHNSEQQSKGPQGPHKCREGVEAAEVDTCYKHLPQRLLSPVTKLWGADCASKSSISSCGLFCETRPHTSSSAGLKRAAKSCLNSPGDYRDYNKDCS